MYFGGGAGSSCSQSQVCASTCCGLCSFRYLVIIVFTLRFSFRYLVGSLIDLLNAYKVDTLKNICYSVG